MKASNNFLILNTTWTAPVSESISYDNSNNMKKRTATIAKTGAAPFAFRLKYREKVEIWFKEDVADLELCDLNTDCSFMQPKVVVPVDKIAMPISAHELPSGKIEICKSKKCWLDCERAKCDPCQSLREAALKLQAEEDKVRLVDDVAAIRAHEFSLMFLA